MAAQPVTFEVEGVQFELRRLNVDDTCAGLAMLTSGGGIGPGQFPALLKLFAPVAKVSRKPDGTFEAGGAMVDLKPFVNDVFAGEHLRMAAFIGKAVQIEYGNFIANAGRLGELLAPGS
jgi:hypothetical protein